jgi:hypothetical protein
MLKVDKAIYITNNAICNNITQLNSMDRGLLSQNILSQMRNFVEYIAIKICYNGSDLDPNDYSLHTKALDFIKSHGEVNFLSKFYTLLQPSVSHYTFDEDASERLMLKYYEYLLRIQQYLKKNFAMDVLENISEFPLNMDTELFDYYQKIVQKINVPSKDSYKVNYDDRYYIQKIKPFAVNRKIYYEITFTLANDKISKFDHIIAFTDQEIMDNYAVKFSIHNDTINILGKDLSILVIDDYEISIRPCEWNNLSKIFGLQLQIGTHSAEYQRLMKYLKSNSTSLTDFVSSDQYNYHSVKKKITENSYEIKIFTLLDKCRDIIISNNPGVNILRYLLYKMNNRIIKKQYYPETCTSLSNLHLSYGCIPFEKMPFCTSLRQHNPKTFDLLEAIPSSGHEHEFLARYIRNNTEIEGHLFTNKSKIKDFENIDDLIKKYNSTLYHKHTGRRIEEYKNHLYIKSYVESTINIIKELQRLGSSGVLQYTASVDSWITREAYEIDDNDKKETIRTMFTHSKVALIYGAAGTGKSTLIRHISNFWANDNKIFLANTHPAVDNLRRKVTTANSNYYTIAKFLSSGNINKNCDVLFIDECSTVNNDDMNNILDKANFKLLVLVGDVYQIESIYFGNWFSIVQKFMPKTSIYELTHPYRTNNKNLLTIWDKVRSLSESILEFLIRNESVARLDNSIFEREQDDEIILCLNYDGLYGINNINHIIQNNNPNEAITWGINTYKVNDPILFNESNIFSPLIHNNSKGKIVGIYVEKTKIRFKIELEDAINSIDAQKYDFELVGESNNGKSIISFTVNKYKNTDEDDDDDSTVVPFQVAYAVSIHKAQGLEYDSVKIIISNETEERITHNIFYTAITRTKNKLKIYWSPETEQSVLKKFELKNFNKDIALLSNLSGLKIVTKNV